MELNLAPPRIFVLHPLSGGGGRAIRGRLSNVARDAAPHKARRIVCGVVVVGRRQQPIRRRMLQRQRERRTIGVARCRSTGIMQSRHRGMRADSEFVQDAGTTRETTSSSSSSTTMGGGRRDATRRWREDVRRTWRSSALSFRQLCNAAWSIARHLEHHRSHSSSYSSSSIISSIGRRRKELISGRRY